MKCRKRAMMICTAIQLRQFENGEISQLTLIQEIFEKSFKQCHTFDPRPCRSRSKLLETFNDFIGYQAISARL